MEPNPANYRFDPEKSLRSVVGLRATVPPHAHSAERVGTERARNGSVVSPHVLVAPVS